MRRRKIRATARFVLEHGRALRAGLPALLIGSAALSGLPGSLLRGDTALAAARPGMGLPSSWTASLSGRSALWYAAFAVFCVSAAAGLVIVLMTLIRQRQRHRDLRVAAAHYVATLHGVTTVTASSPPREPGWTAVGTNPNHQAYWDGKAWTSHRRWTGAEWVEDRPAGSHRSGRQSASLR